MTSGTVMRLAQREAARTTDNPGAEYDHSVGSAPGACLWRLNCSRLGNHSMQVDRTRNPGLRMSTDRERLRDWVTISAGVRPRCHRYGHRHRLCHTPLLVLILWLGIPSAVFADGATRDLSGFTEPGVTFTISIAISPPGTVGVVGLQDKPPEGWTASNIGNGGAWDVDLESVKWPPFFAPSIPDFVSYDITPPVDVPGLHCFSGTISFDGPEQAIAGDECIPIGVPTLTGWGVAVMTILILTVGTILLERRRTSARPA